MRAISCIDLSSLLPLISSDCSFYLFGPQDSGGNLHKSLPQEAHPHIHRVSWSLNQHSKVTPNGLNNFTGLAFG